MKNIVILFVFIFASANSIGQQYIGKSKTEVKESIRKFKAPAGYKTSISNETDSTLQLNFNGRGDLQATRSFLFDKKKICHTEVLTATCDSCLALYLKPVLDIKKFNWVQLNENQYVSDFDSHLMIELQTHKDNRSFRIMRMDWTRELYDILMQK